MKNWQFYKKRYIIAIVISLFFLFFGALQIQAQEVAKPNAPKIVSLVNPIGADNPSIQIIIGKVILQVMGILGALALLVFVYGGFKWLSAAGNEEHIKEGTQAMLWAVIGIFIIFGSYAIIRLIYTGLGIEGSVQQSGDTTPQVKQVEGCYCVMNDGTETTALITDPLVGNEASCNETKEGFLTGVSIGIKDCKWKKASDK